MQVVFASALVVSSLAVSGPSVAYTGMEYAQQCGNSGPNVVLNSPFCRGFLLGFYDALAASGQMCPHKPPTDLQIAVEVQNRLRVLAKHPGNPTGYVVRNALLRVWGCR